MTGHFFWASGFLLLVFSLLFFWFHAADLAGYLSTFDCTWCSLLCRIIMPSVLWCCWLGVRKSIRSVKNWAVRSWCGYLSGAWCGWVAYSPVDATATPSSLASLKFRLVIYLFWLFWLEMEVNVASAGPSQQIHCVDIVCFGGSEDISSVKNLLSVPNSLSWGLPSPWPTPEYRVITTFMEFLETWTCQGILHRSRKRHKVRERSGNLRSQLCDTLAIRW